MPNVHGPVLTSLPSQQLRAVDEVVVTTTKKSGKHFYLIIFLATSEMHLECLILVIN